VNELLLVFPDPAPPLLAQTLDLSGVRWKSVGNAAIAMQYEPVDGWTGAVVCADDDPEGAFGICRSLRKRDNTLEPVRIRTGITDHTVTEVAQVLNGQLNEDDELVTGGMSATSSSNTRAPGLGGESRDGFGFEKGRWLAHRRRKTP